MNFPSVGRTKDYDYLISVSTPLNPNPVLLGYCHQKSSTFSISSVTSETKLFFVFFCRFYWQKSKARPYIDFMQKNYPPGFTYQDFAPHFTAEFFDPKQWTEIFAASGAKYIVLTTKHHEGRIQ